MHPMGIILISSPQYFSTEWGIMYQHYKLKRLIEHIWLFCFKKPADRKHY